MTIIQADLRAKTEAGYRLMTTWLENTKDVKVGSLISLKDVPGKWEIMRVYDKEHDAQEFNWHRKWDNNI